MNPNQRNFLKQYLTKLKNSSTVEQPLSPEQLIGRINLELKQKEMDLIHPKDPEVHMLFRRTPRQVLSETKNNSGNVNMSHDAMFNSSWKVAFESALAAIILRNNHIVKDVVMRAIVTLRDIVLPSLKNKSTETDRGLASCYQNDPNARHAYFARQRDGGHIHYPIDTQKTGEKIPDDQVLTYFQFVFSDDNFEDTFEEKLTAIYNFADFVTRPHKYSKGLNHLNWQLRCHPFLITSMLKDWKKYKHAATPGWFNQEKSGNPSVSRETRQTEGTKKISPLNISNNLSGSYSGIWAVKSNRTVDVFNPYLAYVEDMLVPPFYDITGVGLWRPMDRTNAARDAASMAMHRLDMPMIGGISGGMGSYIIAMKWLGGVKNVTREGVNLAFFAAYSVMISKGYHSFHEVAAVAETLDLWYKHGDYKSVFDESSMAELPEIKELFARFSSLLDRTQKTSSRHVFGFSHYNLYPRINRHSGSSNRRAQTID